MKVSPCPNCESSRQYRTVKPVSAGGGYAPNYLPGLGSMWSAEKFDLVACGDCGLIRYFARDAARAKLSESSKWERV